jgi:uncharacterized repeat protein (TIGR01451 family)
VEDLVPTSLTGVTWTSVGSAGVTGNDLSGSGNIHDTVTLIPAGGTVTYTLKGTIDSAATGTLSNTATVSGANDPNSPDDSATDDDTLTPSADLSITKTDGKTTAVPGTSDTYTIVVTNAGPSAATNVFVEDLVPTSLTGVTWTSVGSTGVTGNDLFGTGDIKDVVTLIPAGCTVTYTLKGTIDPAATGILSNTATVTGADDSNSANNSATDSDTLTPSADLSITKTDGKTTAVPGTSDTYTIVVTNAGPSAVTAATVADTFPPTFTNVTFTATATGGASGFTANGTGNISDTVNMPAGSTITYIATGTISPAATGSLSNAATVTAPAGVTDSNSTNNSATDTDTLTPQADLQITKTDGVFAAVPGTSTTYTIVVTNAGPSNATNVLVQDLVPTTLTGVTWTSVGSSGVTGNDLSGSGNIHDTVTLIPAGGTVTYTLKGTINAAATGTLSNAATVTTPAGVTDPNTGNNSATDTDTLTPQTDLQITKTDGKTTAVPGTNTTYTIVVTNVGPSAATNVHVEDLVPTSLTGVTWTSVGSAGVTGNDVSGSGNIHDTVTLIPAGGTVTYTLKGTIDPAATGTLSNTAIVIGADDANSANNSATDDDTLTPSADLSITKRDGVSAVVPGTGTTYTIIVTNAGPSAATNVLVQDLVPASLTGVTWTSVGSTGVTGNDLSGSGNINDIVTLIPAGGTVTYTLKGTIDPAATGTLSNTATVTGANDPNAANNSATDNDNLTNAFSSLSGSVYVDRNNNGIRDAGEIGIPGVTIRLTGVDASGAAVNATVVTDASGNYRFTRMLPGTYTLTELQPGGFVDGIDRAGTAGGSVSNDVISRIVLGPNQVATGYLFGEKGLAVISKRLLLLIANINRKPGSGFTDVN